MLAANAMSPDSPADPRPSFRALLVVLAGLVWFWGSAWTASKDLPPVADEVAHLTGGEFYWHYGVNHLQPENAWFAMHWATLPFRWHPPVFPVDTADVPQASAMMVVGNRF